MTFEDFRALVGTFQHDIPAEFEGGVVAVDVSPKAVPHPVYAGVYTLGECIPIEWSESGANLQSRIVLYYGSFAALARRNPGFDWRAEAWDTLAHELRHHLEWRARIDALELYDWAAEQNFARHEGHAFDPVFYKSGERIAPGVYKVDDDVFVEGDGTFTWHGRRYHVNVPKGPRPQFLTLRGLVDPPPGEAVLVVPRRFSLLDLWRRQQINQATVHADPVNA